MEQIKIIFFDIDGTLVDPQTRQISPLTLLALRQLREQGIRICLATGRSPISIPQFDSLDFDAYITINGSLCYTDKEVIFSNPIHPRSAKKVMENAAALGRPVSISTRKGLSANGIDTDLYDYYRLADLELTVDENFEAASKEDIYQIMLGSREEEHASIIQGVENVKIAISWDRAIDIIPLSGGKGTAILHVLSHFGLTPSQAIAFGDSHNDIEMLQTVGTGVAMGNATEQLKAIASDICGPVSQDGIYYYCLEHGLI